MKFKHIVSALASVAVGVAATWSVGEYLSLKSELQTIQTLSQPAAQPAQPAQPQPAQSTQLVAATQTAQPVQQSAQPDFETLSLCEQLDAIAKSGKSVAQFIAASGRYREFQAQVTANCNWNAEQLQQAYAILHPPVQVRTVTREIVVNQPGQTTARSVPAPAAPSRPWNNCNGIQEAGESYSVECHRDQEFNDRHPGNLAWTRDRREPDDFGVMPESNGYSAR